VRHLRTYYGCGEPNKTLEEREKVERTNGRVQKFRPLLSWESECGVGKGEDDKPLGWRRPALSLSLSTMGPLGLDWPSRGSARERAAAL
jgi:hypothetical protein